MKFRERLHTIASMREHLSTLQEINDALSKNEFDRASHLAEQRLGMTSLEAHGAAHLAPYTPERMQKIGTQMHRVASEFLSKRKTQASTMTPGRHWRLSAK